MALVLTLKPKEKIRIGDVEAFVEPSPESDIINLNVGGVLFEITDQKAEEVLPDVFVSAGEYNEAYQQFRLLFDAPRSIIILREELVKNDG